MALGFLNGETPKRIENRTWKPKSDTRYVALHAANSWDMDGKDFIEAQTGLVMPGKERHPKGVIFAVCKLIAVFHVRGEYPDAVDVDQAPWAFGPWCWAFGDFVPLSVPVTCRGNKGLWDIEGALLSQVRQAYTQSRVEQKHLKGE